MSLKPREPEPELVPMPEHISTIVVKWYGGKTARLPREQALEGVLAIADKICPRGK